MTIIEQATLFDYTALDSETRIVVQQRTSEIKTLMRRAASDIIEIGQKLIDVKARLGHGNFGGWLVAEFDWTDRTARQFMQVADTFKSENFSDLRIAPSALYLLAAQSTPESARTEALDRAAAGEVITHSTAVAIKNDHQRIHSSATNEWYTPANIIEAARQALGDIDLDPASCEAANVTVRADRYHTSDDDGLAQPWHGRVWLNPPYGKTGGESNQAIWSRRLIAEYEAGRTTAAILLVNAVPGNEWFTPLKQYPICFPNGRLRFVAADGSPGPAPTHGNALIYFGPDVARFRRAFSDIGQVLMPPEPAPEPVTPPVPLPVVISLDPERIAALAARDIRYITSGSRKNGAEVHKLHTPTGWQHLEIHQVDDLIQRTPLALVEPPATRAAAPVDCYARAAALGMSIVPARPPETGWVPLWPGEHARDMVGMDATDLREWLRATAPGLVADRFQQDKPCLPGIGFLPRIHSDDREYVARLVGNIAAAETAPTDGALLAELRDELEGAADSLDDHTYSRLAYRLTCMERGELPAISPQPSAITHQPSPIELIGRWPAEASRAATQLQRVLQAPAADWAALRAAFAAGVTAMDQAIAAREAA